MTRNFLVALAVAAFYVLLWPSGRRGYGRRREYNTFSCAALPPAEAARVRAAEAEIHATADALLIEKQRGDIAEIAAKYDDLVATETRQQAADKARGVAELAEYNRIKRMTPEQWAVNEQGIELASLSKLEDKELFDLAHIEHTNRNFYYMRKSALARLFESPPKTDPRYTQLSAKSAAIEAKNQPILEAAAANKKMTLERNHFRRVDLDRAAKERTIRFEEAALEFEEALAKRAGPLKKLEDTAAARAAAAKSRPVKQLLDHLETVGDHRRNIEAARAESASASESVARLQKADKEALANAAFPEDRARIKQRMDQRASDWRARHAELGEQIRKNQLALDNIDNVARKERRATDAAAAGRRESIEAGAAEADEYSKSAYKLLEEKAKTLQREAAELRRQKGPFNPKQRALERAAELDADVAFLKKRMEAIDAQWKARPDVAEAAARLSELGAKRAGQLEDTLKRAAQKFKDGLARSEAKTAAAAEARTTRITPDELAKSRAKDVVLEQLTKQQQQTGRAKKPKVLNLGIFGKVQLN